MSRADKKQTKEIDGFTYEVTPLAASVGLKALRRTLAVVSPVLAALVKAQTEAEGLAGVLEALSESLSDDDVTYLAKIFGDTSTFENETGSKVPLDPKIQDDHFAGRYKAFMEWVTFCMQVNFSGFFTGANGATGLEGLMAMLKRKT